MDQAALAELVTSHEHISEDSKMGENGYAFLYYRVKGIYGLLMYLENE